MSYTSFASGAAATAQAQEFLKESPKSLLLKTLKDFRSELLTFLDDYIDPDKSITLSGRTFAPELKYSAAVAYMINQYLSDKENQATSSQDIIKVLDNFDKRMYDA